MGNPPSNDYLVYIKKCEKCKTPYRYQEYNDGIFNFIDDKLLISFPVLLELRSGLVNHTAVSRVVSMIGYRLKCKLNEFVMTCAYLAFEACSGHDYGFTCNRCGFYPKCLIYDLTKKAVFDFAFSEVSPPQNPSETVDAEKFWGDLRSEIVSRCSEGGRTVKIKPNYTFWAPYIGPNTRKDNNLYNTEYEKITSPDPEESEPVPEETIQHL